MTASHAKPLNPPPVPATSYASFGREPEYVEANRGFVARRDLGEARRILDLACGTGTSGALLMEAAPRAHLNGIDVDPEAVQLATERFEGLGRVVRAGFEVTEDAEAGRPVVVLGVRSADDLPFEDGTFDAVTICNAIHMMPDVDRFLDGVRRVLAPGGTFGFNTGFYAGSYPEGTEAGLVEWGKAALTYVQRLGEQRKAAGEPPIKRKRGARGAFQNRWRSPDEWVGKLAEHGFVADDVGERTVMLDESSLAALGGYGGFAEVVMSGYPVEVSTEALRNTAGEALAALGLDAVPRLWLEMWATRE